MLLDHRRLALEGFELLLAHVVERLRGRLDSVFVNFDLERRPLRLLRPAKQSREQTGFGFARRSHLLTGGWLFRDGQRLVDGLKALEWRDRRELARRLERGKVD